jgi:hypothetical protein
MNQRSWLRRVLGLQQLVTNRPASYALHIRPLFTKKQVDCMAFMFQLDAYEDVKSNAESIYARLADHSMPMDETRPWPDEWIALFRRWIDEGSAA